MCIRDSGSSQHEGADDLDRWGTWRSTQKSGQSQEPQAKQTAISKYSGYVPHAAGMPNPQTSQLAKLHAVALPHIAVLGLTDISNDYLDDNEQIVSVPRHPYADIPDFERELEVSPVSTKEAILALTGSSNDKPCAIGSNVARFIVYNSANRAKLAEMFCSAALTFSVSGLEQELASLCY